MFAFSKDVRPRLMLPNKAGAYLSGVLNTVPLLALSVHIRQDSQYLLKKRSSLHSFMNLFSSSLTMGQNKLVHLSQVSILQASLPKCSKLLSVHLQKLLIFFIALNKHSCNNYPKHFLIKCKKKPFSWTNGPAYFTSSSVSNKKVLQHRHLFRML